MASDSFENILLGGDDLKELIANGNEIEVGVVLTSDTVPSSLLQKNSRSKSGNWICKVCKRVFTNSSNLKSHVKIHEGQKQYKCDICDLSFVQHSNLKAHRRIHTGERPYKCKYCEKGFIRSTHLIEHQRIHTGEKPHVCGSCNQRFSSSTLLRNHFNRKHKNKPKVAEDKKPFICRLCNITFESQVEILKHLDFHKSQVKFRCSDCPRYFKREEDCNAHRKEQHQDVKPFLCGFCYSAFKTFEKFLKHMNDVHPEVPTDDEEEDDDDVLLELGEEDIKTEQMDLEEQSTSNEVAHFTSEVSHSGIQISAVEPIISSMNSDVQHTINILDPSVLSNNESDLSFLNSFEAAIVNTNDVGSTIEILDSITEVIEDEKNAEERARNLLAANTQGYSDMSCYNITTSWNR